MKLLTALFNFVQSKLRGESLSSVPIESVNSQSANEQWLIGYKAFKEGQRLYFEQPTGHIFRDVREKRFQRALQHYDTAIENGFEEGVYGSRGSCLQSLGFHPDAIDDLDKAIGLEPTDSNLWFMRSNSKGAMGDFSGETSDLMEAIRVAESHSDQALNEMAQEQGYPNVACFYKQQLQIAMSEMAMQEKMDRLVKERPKLKRQDMSSILRARAKRRPST
jgi:tetratricopeptide (TPR) repeat protein